MEPIVMDGQEVTVEPRLSGVTIEKGDVVLCKVRGREFFHKVLALDRRGTSYQIGNNKGGVNGWIRSTEIYGKLVRE